METKTSPHPAMIATEAGTFRTEDEQGMTQTVTLPVWVLTILVLFAAWAVLDRLLLPACAGISAAG